MSLATVDLLDQEILRAGGPFHGVGSPPEGDHLSIGDLQGMAAAFAELRDELHPPVKLGHGKGQELLSEHSFAAGWLDNVRVVGDRLVADLRKVPKLVADLIRAGAWRTKSSEFGPHMATDGRVFPMVVKALSLQGARLPAVRSLSDLTKLYEADGDVYYAETAAGGLVAEAVEDGRLAAADAPVMARLVATSEMARRTLSELRPDPARAHSNFVSTPEGRAADERNRRGISERFGIPLEHVL